MRCVHFLQLEPNLPTNVHLWVKNRHIKRGAACPFPPMCSRFKPLPCQNRSHQFQFHAEKIAISFSFTPRYHKNSQEGRQDESKRADSVIEKSWEGRKGNRQVCLTDPVRLHRDYSWTCEIRHKTGALKGRQQVLWKGNMWFEREAGALRGKHVIWKESRCFETGEGVNLSKLLDLNNRCFKRVSISHN